MYIQLEQKDYEAIAEMVDECYNGPGQEVSYSEIDIRIPFSKKVRRHRDTDYYNGTGEWVVDDVEFSLGVVDGLGLEVKYNHKEMEKTIKDYLWRR